MSFAQYLLLSTLGAGGGVFHFLTKGGSQNGPILSILCTFTFVSCSGTKSLCFAAPGLFPALAFSWWFVCLPQDCHINAEGDSFRSALSLLTAMEDVSITMIILHGLRVMSDFLPGGPVAYGLKAKPEVRAPLRPRAKKSRIALKPWSIIFITCFIWY